MRKLIGLVVLASLSGCSGEDEGHAKVEKAAVETAVSTIAAGANGAPLCSSRKDAQTIADGLLLGWKDTVAEGESKCDVLAPGTQITAQGGVEKGVLGISANGVNGYTVYTRLSPSLEQYPAPVSRMTHRVVRLCADWSDAYMAYLLAEHNMVESAQKMSGCKSLWAGTTVQIIGEQGESYVVPATRDGVQVNAFVVKKSLDPIQIRSNSGTPEL